MSMPERVGGAIEPLLNTALDMDAAARERVERLDGSALIIEVSGLGWRIPVVAEMGRLRVATAEIDETANTATISGPPASLARLTTQGGTQVLFSGSLHVRGDVQVAKAFKRLFDTLDPDWEEALARLLGDIPAHESARLVRAIGASGRRLLTERGRDLGDWLVDEAELTPATSEAEGWLTDIDRLRADADRLQARIARLERRNDEHTGSEGA